MINLLPPEEKRQIKAARSNSLLLRYNIFSLAALVFLAAAIAVAYIYLTNTKAAAEQTIADSQSRVASYAPVKAEADSFRSNLTTAKQILDREVTYTNVILQIANLLPSGITLSELHLDAQTFGTATTLSAQAKSYESAIALKDAFQASDMFSDVHFQSITTSTDSSSGYPYTVTLGVTIKKEAAKE